MSLSHASLAIVGISLQIDHKTTSALSFLNSLVHKSDHLARSYRYFNEAHLIMRPGSQTWDILLRV